MTVITWHDVRATGKALLAQAAQHGNLWAKVQLLIVDGDPRPYHVTVEVRPLWSKGWTDQRTFKRLPAAMTTYHDFKGQATRRLLTGN